MIKIRGRLLEKSFEENIIKYQDLYYKLAFSYVKNEYDAKDILQESILKAYKNISKLKDIDALDKWMKRIIINTALDFIKKNSKLSLTIDDNNMMDIPSKEVNSELIYIVDDLEPDLRTIIILKYYHGYTIEEVADILEISISMVKNRMHKALKLLRIEIKECESIE